MQYINYMEKAKNFMNNISQTGWIIISAVVVIILLILIGFLLVRSGKTFWPLMYFVDTEEKVLIELENERASSDYNENKSIDEANDVVLSFKDIIDLRADNSVAAATLLAKGTEKVQVAFITDQEINGVVLENNSCGNVVNVLTVVPSRPAILNEAIKSLFGGMVISDVMPGNVIAKNTELFFERAVIENGEAIVLLNGSFEEGECNRVNVMNQIKYTVLNFETVDSVAIFLNGEEL